ncbi:MAG: NAD(P)H-dependent oxidoreductase subunit E [Planctomycetes bacterium]|jgi:NADH-quinone oxidoreductase subunit E|nr:NAD(P)H-dependent oxidoreductase subunit E [Planctomycetota bacterium]
MSEPAIVIDAKRVSDLLDRLPAGEASALPEALRAAQAAFRHVPREVAAAVARRLSVPASRVFGLATFHGEFSLFPKGEVVLKVCTGAACHGRGAPTLLDELLSKLGIASGGTTKDLKFTVETTNCVGACAMAPVVSVNGELRGNAEPSAMAKELLGGRS